MHHETTAPAEAAGTRLVLVVDDEPANQRALRRALRDECEVETAGSGAEALAIMARRAVALVIADQRLPGMSGTEFLAHTVREFPSVIRVVLTGYTDVETLLDAINAGHVYHFLTKPWETRELRQVVRRGLERHAAEAERVRLLGELERACARARREAEQKDRLLTMSAHELGTPVHIALNAIGLLQDAEVPGAAREWLQTAERALHWLARGVTQLHTAAAVQQRPLRVRPEPIDLGRLFADVADALRGVLQSRRLQFTTTLDQTAKGLRADPRWLRQAVWDLLTNAVRCTPDGGWIRLAAHGGGPEVVVEVSDSGIGIAPECLGEIFEPFSATTGDPLLHGSGRFQFGARGLGLGLAVVKRIADAHGGRVTVRSAPHGGSCFALHLPRSA